MTSASLRQSFFDFFAEKDHTIVPSASILPSSPNLLFTNAGMNQFVPYFLGEQKAPYPRIADTQKCIRAGGKHNDLEDVGFDTYHHTFFEMLGNWSFGDYFKAEAIAFAWELLTRVWKFPRQRLYVTVYQPGPGEPAVYDEEAADLWSKLLLADGLDPQKHIRTGGKADNFWMMGDTGPCGPCSEIHIDLTPAGDSNGTLVNADSPWCIEIWNLVFIQFNAEPDGSLLPLPARHVDTGMGFERVAGILATTQQFSDFSQAPSNYNSDLFTDLFAHLSSQCLHQYQRTMPKDRENLSPVEQRDCAFRVIADHIRTLSFSIADGILPSNEGRGYVLRRILRRAVLFGKRLDLPSGFFSGLAPVLIQKMASAFPELRQQEEVILKVLQSEEATFEKTLERGIQQFDKFAAEGRVGGEEAFALYDTYGFPLDLTQLLAGERKLSVDVDGFERLMEEQRQKARSAQKKEVIRVSDLSQSFPETEFIGYTSTEPLETTLLGLQEDADGNLWAIFDRTNFYPEMGGQIGDTGVAKTATQSFRVADTRKDKQGHILHRLESLLPDQPPLRSDSLSQETSFTLTLDLERRSAVQRHHTGTHLINWGLRSLLGSHIRQAGSFVSSDRLRFDFSHFEAIPLATLQEIEQMVNTAILENHPVVDYEIPYRDKPDDVVAVFGEKYGTSVRVVDIGGFAKELCGGTHVRALGEVGLCRIISETGISAGTRRIEAVCGTAAYQTSIYEHSLLQEMAQLFACSIPETLERANALLQQKASLEKQLQSIAQSNAAATASDLVSKAFTYRGLNWVAAIVDLPSNGNLRDLASSIAGNPQIDVVLLITSAKDKTSVLALVNPPGREQDLSASTLVKDFAASIGGKGGGKPDFAMGGGPARPSLKDDLQAFLRQLGIEA